MNGASSATEDIGTQSDIDTGPILSPLLSDFRPGALAWYTKHVDLALLLLLLLLSVLNALLPRPA